jgi:hypothetical protein
VAAASEDAGTSVLKPIDASFPPVVDAGPVDAARPDAATLVVRGDADAAGAARVIDAAGAVDAPPSRFITEVLNFQQGTCAGFGAASLPGIVEGPPVGLGSQQGSLDVVSLGGGGSIVVGFGPNAIVDGPGVDFVVFENPFFYPGDAGRYAEPGEVAVSDDAVHWTAFPCTDTTQVEPDGGWAATRCGGINPVYSNPDNDISPFDLERAGGDQYDLAEIGVTHARYVRVRNIVASEPCPEAGPKPDKNGFDLDAIAIINAALP